MQTSCQQEPLETPVFSWSCLHKNEQRIEKKSSNSGTFWTFLVSKKPLESGLLSARPLVRIQYGAPEAHWEVILDGLFCAVCGCIGKDKPIPIAPPLPLFTTFLLHLLPKQYYRVPALLHMGCEKCLHLGIFPQTLAFLRESSYAPKRKAVGSNPAGEAPWHAAQVKSKKTLPRRERFGSKTSGRGTDQMSSSSL